jgi:hypothetical protein
MQDRAAMTYTDDLSAIEAEILKTRETADRIANGEQPADEADETRVLAGLIRQLADQLSRTVEQVFANQTGRLETTDDRQREVERLEEEDVTPTDAPAEPARDRFDGGREGGGE